MFKQTLNHQHSWKKEIEVPLTDLKTWCIKRAKGNNQLTNYFNKALKHILTSTRQYTTKQDDKIKSKNVNQSGKPVKMLP